MSHSSRDSSAGGPERAGAGATLRAVAHIDDLVGLVGDPGLRADLRRAVEGLRGKRQFGLVFEHHTPAPVPMSDLTPVAGFGEPVYPTLEHLGSVEHGAPGGAPHHLVIEAENYHALQLLAFLYEGQVDCVYIDPPYNSGATDWAYNNRYADPGDAYPHSEWLSMMDQRLRLACRLLKQDATLVVTIDEHEVCRLGLLLEQIFDTARIQLVTIRHE